MQRYFISPNQMKDTICFIDGQDAHHITNVMRLQLGDELICCNGEGRSVYAKIRSVEKDNVECDILHDLERSRELSIFVTIAQGLPKGDKLEWVVQKGTEMGAHRFIPFSSSRTVVKYDAKKERKRVERWEKISKEAAEQSHRDRLPQVEHVYSFKELLNVKADHKLIAYERAADHTVEGPTSFVQTLDQLQKGEHLLVVIGPEGGLSEEEVQTLEEHGFQTISLGKRILRTETASQYVLAAISFYFEQMGG